jgi:hypothetical protein
MYSRDWSLRISWAIFRLARKAQNTPFTFCLLTRIALHIQPFPCYWYLSMSSYQDQSAKRDNACKTYPCAQKP